MLRRWYQFGSWLLEVLITNADYVITYPGVSSLRTGSSGSASWAALTFFSFSSFSPLSLFLWWSWLSFSFSFLSFFVADFFVWVPTSLRLWRLHWVPLSQVVRLLFSKLFRWGGRKESFSKLVVLVWIASSFTVTGLLRGESSWLFWCWRWEVSLPWFLSISALIAGKI